jgi:putative endonuclease
MSTTPPASTRARGRASEDLAASFLEARGLVICARNVTLAHAELDLVARITGAPDTLVFVEIRSRKDDRAGDPAETVDRSKQRRVIRAATAWLLREELWERVAVRFDVLTILFGDDKAPEITWIPGAFEVDG